MLADALNDALRAAPEGAVIVITKQDGQVGARFIEVAEEDDTGRRMLFITGGTFDAGPVPSAAGGSPSVGSPPQNF